MGSRRCDLTSQPQSFHWEKVFRDFGPSLCVLDQATGGGKPQKWQQQQEEEDKRCSGGKQTRLYIWFHLGLNHCGTTVQKTHDAASRWASDVITNNAGFTTVSVGARLPQKCLVKKLYVPNCMIALTLFFPSSKLFHTGRWLHQAIKTLSQKWKWTDASLHSQPCTLSLYYL